MPKSNQIKSSPVLSSKQISPAMALNKFQLLRRLRDAVNKVKFLLSFNARRWILSSVTGSSRRQRRLSFNRQSSGLLDCTSEDYYDTGSSFALSRSTSLVTDRSRLRSPRSEMTRSISDASSSGDIDARAEDFIANFYRHILRERQVSLQLRYCRGKKGGGLERTFSD